VAARATNAYWGRDGLDRTILEALRAAGRNVDALTVDELAPADQFHSGGKSATQRLARLAALRPGLSVLDVGGGLGGPARTLATEFGCRVTVIDLTESYVRAGAALTARLGLGDRVTHHVGDALALDVAADAFDVAAAHRDLTRFGRIVFGVHKLYEMTGKRFVDRHNLHHWAVEKP
jgi:predicted O-methyltransferase YrrM